jgi:SAM-dependent methyltransferase
VSERPVSPLAPPTDYAGYAQWKSWDAVAFMAPSPHERGYYAAELRGHAIAGKPVLELGFGNGGFLAWARDQGAIVHGTELQPELASRGSTAGIIVEPSDLAALLPAASGKFALVAAFDVFEHIEIAALAPLLATIADLLEDGGLLIARYPNGQSPFGRVHQHGDMTHRTTLSADIMRQLVATLPFDEVHLGNPARPAGAVNAARAIVQRLHEIALQRLYGHDTPLGPNSVAILRRRARSTASPHIHA